MTSCVTGAAGFIGKNLVEELRSKEEDVIECDPRDLRMINPDDLLSHISEKNIKAIYHLGAISSTTEKNTESLIRENILFSSKILEFCEKRNIPMIYASSASVYGDGKFGFTENNQCDPMNYYAISKLSFDMIVDQKIRDNPNLKVFGLRYFNVYGHNESHKGDMASPVYKFFDQSNRSREIKIFEGSENFLRDFIHVEDVVKITIESRQFEESGIYNVGTGNPRSFKDVAEIISNLTKSDIVEIPFPDHLVGKYQKFTCSDNKKISKFIKFERQDIFSGIKKTSEKLLENKNK